MNDGYFEKGRIFINGRHIRKVSEINWDTHPKFSGVSTKNLLGGKDCNFLLSSMIVKIDAGCEIGDHIHDGKSELHEVIAGNGVAVVDDVRIEYAPGVISYIPGNIRHSVKAGDAGMILMAKFTPPLN